MPKIIILHASPIPRAYDNKYVFFICEEPRKSNKGGKNLLKQLATITTTFILDATNFIRSGV